LIKRNELFEEFADAADLLRAIHEAVPQFDASDEPYDLVQLAGDCLQKDPKRRLELVLNQANPEG
jgi:hypothetical protein